MELLDYLFNIVAAGYIWNIIIILKHGYDISEFANFSHMRSKERLKKFNIFDVIAKKWYIPFGTLLTYKPILPGFREYRKTHELADTIDYCYYLSLQDYKKLD